MSRRGRGQRCAYCQRTLEGSESPSLLAATRDHVVPRSRAVPKDRIYGTRKVLCCRQCNMLKANMMPDEWSEFMRQNPAWWLKSEFRRGIPLKNRGLYLAPAARSPAAI